MNLPKILLFTALFVSCKNRPVEAELTSDGPQNASSFLLERVKLTPDQTNQLIRIGPKLLKPANLNLAAAIDPVTVIVALKSLINIGKLGRELFDVYGIGSSKFTSEDIWASATPKGVDLETMRGWSDLQFKTLRVQIPNVNPIFTGTLTLMFRNSGGTFESETKKLGGYFLTHVTFAPNIEIAKGFESKTLKLSVRKIDPVYVGDDPKDPIASMSVILDLTTSTKSFRGFFEPDKSMSVVFDLRGDSDLVTYHNGTQSFKF